MVKDPVCGMMVKEDEAIAKSEYKGKAYYFCSNHCKMEFDKNPEKYVRDEMGHGHHEHRNHGCC
ncbi:hypothetical protein THYS13_21150 [Thermoanaerobacter sp. YS13]|uniref:YHS domain-containing protein n=1 Tax=Thermoanaerobacter sp. YS13 TaxID=1511746 RepID=UPI0005740FD3|nr:YHS domain-containing protein [Thermoanaerobacter sp. YS13]KHO61672.1 hypothetical protein THYS13_21150 [Thermoanaerobacter sp. YS13]